MRTTRISMLIGSLAPLLSVAQEVVIGEVTFITAQHVYVRFEQTEGIAVADTLEVLRDGQSRPCLIVSNMSSTSCVCTVVDGCVVEKQDRVQARRQKSEKEAVRSARPERASKAQDSADSSRSSDERIRGRVSAASYSTMPSARENDHRLMYRVSVDADHIAGSKFSAETYLNYRKLYPADPDRRPQRTEIFNVYSAAVSYEPDSNTVITVGRKINNNISSLGAIDGLQAERTMGSFLAGAIVGFRPDIFTYDLNTDLLQYGGYVGTRTNTAALNTHTTIGLMQQTNSGMIDRRYAYMQHSSTFRGNLNLFGSGELDLYSTLNGGARLTNLFVSARYRINRMVDVFGSYDSRKRVIYYETFRNDVEVMLDDDDARQGARLRLNVKPMKALSLGTAYSRRFQADGANRSENVQLFLNYSRDPMTFGRWSIQANRNTSNYVRSDVLSFRHSRTLIPKRLDMSLYYRAVEYIYGNRTDGSPFAARTSQRYYGADLMLTLARTLTFTLLGELSTLREEKNYRVNMCLTKRFDSKKRR